MIPFSFVVLFFVFRAVLNEGKNSYGCYVVEKEIAVGMSCILDMFFRSLFIHKFANKN